MFTALLLITLALPYRDLGLLAGLLILILVSLSIVYFFRSRSLVLAAFGVMLGTVAGVYCLAWALRPIPEQALPESFYTGVRNDVHRMAYLTTLLFEMRAEEATQSLLSQPRYQDSRRLNRFEAKVYSQGGEDGSITEIFRRIGTTNKVFVEIGSGEGQENNTVFLLRNGWTGLWVDAKEGALSYIQKNFEADIQQRRLVFLNSFVTAENAEALLEQGKIPAEFDLLSIDIDRNDYWVWQKIERYRPRAVVIEYNSIFPPGVEWVVEYDPKAWWDGTSHFGVSLKSLELLGRKKGYVLVGCTLGGVNAFFVREDLVNGRFSAPYTAENHYEPPRYSLSLRTFGHPRRP